MMKSLPFVFMGERSTYWNLYFGWGILVGVLLCTLAGILWILSDVTTLRPRSAGAISAVISTTSLVGALADKLSGAGAADVASGKVEMVILPVSEILPVHGVDLVGTIPADLQFVPTFAAAIVKGAQNPEAAKRLIDFLTSDKATPTVEKTGMERAEKTVKH